MYHVLLAVKNLRRTQALMETFGKRDHMLKNPRRCAGEPGKLEDWKATGQELKIDIRWERSM